ncbi:outer membrane beta-barrel protein [Bacteroidota bacterium]
MATKNIDRLFQEKLKDLEMNPSPAVWDTIENSLAAKKKKRVAFWWWRVSGSVAAALLIGFLWTTNTETKIETPIIENSITNTEEEKIELQTIPTNKANVPVTIQPEISEKTKIALEKKPSIKTKKIIENFKTENIIQNPENSIAEIDSLNQPKKTIFETLEEQNIAQAEKPIINNPTSKKKNKIDNGKIALEEIVNNEENLSSKKNNWIIAPSISQLRPSSFSNKSSIDQSLDAATKKGNDGTSFGVKIAFQASKKWQIQSGIHRLKLGQTTQNIALNSNSQISSLDNLSYDAPRFSELSSDSGNSLQGSKEFSSNNNSDLKQTYGYIEVPLEVKYALLQSKKLEFHLVSGISTLFLTTNNLQIQNENLSYSIGEASNLNTVDFSLNFGTDLEYHFSKKWFFNMAPMLKLQTNTFNSTSNKPYFFGVYTGLNYKF